MLDASDAKSQCTHAAEALGGANSERASEIILQHSDLPAEWGANFRYDTKRYFETTGTSLGALVGAEFVRTEELGKSLNVHYYWIKFAMQPMVFQCVAYRAVNEWKIIGVTFQEDISIVK